VPGGPVAVDDVTTHYFEFDISPDHDNSWLEGTATPAQPADLDLYLDRQRADGSWTEVAAGTNDGDTTGEDISTEGSGTRLLPGHYRLEVHNFLGPPANEIAIALTFFNTDGEPGS
jgi:hypothetical protein